MTALPLLLVPGMMCDARLFTPQISALSRHYPIHCAWVGGYGTVERLAIEILNHAPPRFNLAGLSMGGIIAMELIRQAPERVDRLALLNTNCQSEKQKVREYREPLIARVQAGELEQVMKQELRPRYLAEGNHRKQIMELWLQMALDLGTDVFVRQSRALQQRADQKETLAKVRVPTLILCGAEDELCPIGYHELMHSLIPGSHLEIIDKAGHLSTLEQPEATTMSLLRWLQAS
ncbi:MAG: alpha/beta fold hydrolase [Desulforhopalus sp.]